jgi:hypothetical protein
VIKSGPLSIPKEREQAPISLLAPQPRDWGHHLQIEGRTRKLPEERSPRSPVLLECQKRAGPIFLHRPLPIGRRLFDCVANFSGLLLWCHRGISLGPLLVGAKGINIISQFSSRFVLGGRRFTIVKRYFFFKPFRVAPAPSLQMPLVVGNSFVWNCLKRRLALYRASPFL